MSLRIIAAYHWYSAGAFSVLNNLARIIATPKANFPITKIGVRYGDMLGEI
jgi:hypothetical protein